MCTFIHEVCRTHTYSFDNSTPIVALLRTVTNCSTDHKLLWSTCGEVNKLHCTLLEWGVVIIGSSLNVIGVNGASGSTISYHCSKPLSQTTFFLATYGFTMAHAVPINCYGHDSQRLSNAILSFNGE